MCNFGSSGWFFLGFFLMVRGSGGVVVMSGRMHVVGGGRRCDGVIVGESHGRRGRRRQEGASVGLRRLSTRELQKTGVLEVHTRYRTEQC